MAVMTISEARAALPEVVSRVEAGEEFTITRHGRPTAVVVRPDIYWAQAGTEIVLAEPRELAAALRERARRNGRSLEQEIRAIVQTTDGSESRGLPPLEDELVMGRSGGRSTWPREEIYDDEGL